MGLNGRNSLPLAGSQVRRTGLCYEKALAYVMITHSFLLPEPPGERGCFSDLPWENRLGLLQAKPLEVCPQGCNLQGFLILTLAHTQPTAIHQNHDLSDPVVYGSRGFCSR